MSKKKVWVVGPWYAGVIGMFAKRGFTGARGLDEADILIWMGGEDISPTIYNEEPIDHGYRWYNTERDRHEIEAYNLADSLQFKIGICRGGQLLNCLNGGTLWQDVNNHFQDHWMKDLETSQVLKTSSIHHQMMRPTSAAQVVAAARKATIKRAYGRTWASNKEDIPNTALSCLTSLKPENVLVADDIDPEVIFYPESSSLCIQGHPEAGPPALTDYMFQLIERFM